MQNNQSMHLRNFLIDQNVIHLQIDFHGDAILDPIGQDLVALALGIDEEDLDALVNSCLLPKTCVLEMYGKNPSYYFNYWDTLQASVFCSLISIGLHNSLVCDFSESLCDLLSSVFEDSPSSNGIDIDSLTNIIGEEIKLYSDFFDPQLSKYGREAVVAKIAIDLLNVNARLARWYSHAIPVECRRSAVGFHSEPLC